MIFEEFLGDGGRELASFHESLTLVLDGCRVLFFVGADDEREISDELYDGRFGGRCIGNFPKGMMSVFK